jgi:hypothetical protein
MATPLFPLCVGHMSKESKENIDAFNKYVSIATAYLQTLESTHDKWFYLRNHLANKIVETLYDKQNPEYLIYGPRVIILDMNNTKVYGTTHRTISRICEFISINNTPQERYQFMIWIIVRLTSMILNQIQGPDPVI